MRKAIEKKEHRKTQKKVAMASPTKVRRQAPAARHPRRFVRIEISSPVTFVPFRLPLTRPLGAPAEGAWTGKILNLSGGGILLETDTWVEPSDYMLLKIGLFENCHLENVAGRVKRSENCGDGKCLVGIEFLTREMMQHLQSDLPDGFLPAGAGIFDEKLRELLSRQIFSKQKTA